METVSDIVLESQVAILTGGVDKNETPLITFPTDVGDLVDIYSLGDILRLLQMCVRIAGWKVVILADLQHDWTPEGITKLMTLLDELQMDIRPCLTTVYLVKPRARRKGKILYRELSRNYGPGRMVPFYTVKRLENHEELYDYIDKAQLTPDYGGTMQYDHSVWMRFQKERLLENDKYCQTIYKRMGKHGPEFTDLELISPVYYPVITKAEKLLSEIPSIKDGVIKLLESAKKISIDGDTHLKEINAKYESLLSKSHVRELMENCNMALSDIESPSNTSCYQIQPSLLVKTTKDIKTLSSKLGEEINEMDSMLNAYTRVSDIHSKLRQCKENADEVIDSITLLNEEIKCLPVIGQSIADAQCNRQTFIEEILNPSKDIVACSTVILNQLDNGKDTTPKSYAASFEIAKQLTEALQPFIQLVNNMNEMYTRTHLFFVLMEKVTRWNPKACMFITRNTNKKCATEFSQYNCRTNEVISSHCQEASYDENSENISPTEHSSKLIDYTFTDSWPVLLEKFTEKHPFPKRRHLKLLTKNVPDCIETQFKEEANNLVERTIFILSFLDKDVHKSEDLALIRKWCQLSYRTQNFFGCRNTNEVSTV